MFDTSLRIITAVAFLGYGLTCVFSMQMEKEFVRFGVPRYRFLVGSTQVMASLGLFLAPGFPWLGLMASAGLALQMLAGTWVRFRIGDTFLQASQAMLFAVITLYLAFRFWQVL
jgi:hypothetical protein